MPITPKGDGEDEFVNDIQSVMKVWIQTVHVKIQTRNETSSEVRNTTESSDADIALLETSYYHLERHMWRHICLQKQHRNKLLPISQLPDELLVRIIYFSLQQSFSPTDYVEELQNVAQVCTAWSEVVKGTALLWGVASSHDPIAIVRRALSKSGSAPLDIWYDGACDTTSQRALFLQIMIEQSHRWRSLDLRAADRDVENRLMQLATPMLCDLKISDKSFIYGDGLERYPDLSMDIYNPSVSDSDDDGGGSGEEEEEDEEEEEEEEEEEMRDEPLAAQTLPFNIMNKVNDMDTNTLYIPSEKLYPLRHFGIIERSTLWEPNALSRLESLELRNPGHARRIKITEIITILRSSEGLVILTLDQLQLDDLDDIAHDTAPVELSRLTDLTLSSLPLHGLHDLLTRIRVPICRRLILDCTDRPYANILDSQTAHLGPPIQAILSATRNARLHITPDKVQLFATLDDFPRSVFVYLHLPSVQSSGPMDWLNHTLSSMTRPPTIGLIIEARKSSKLIPPPLDILPYVDLLQIINSKKEAVAWIQLLHERVPSADGESQWMLPRMTHLMFRSCHLSTDDFMEMLDRRYGRRRGVSVKSQKDEDGDDARREAERSGREPALLKLLQLSGKNLLGSTGIHRVQSIVGTKACSWRCIVLEDCPERGPDD